MEITITIHIKNETQKPKTLLQDWSEKMNNWIKDDNVNHFPKNENLN